jgi:arabinofuranosyltransferase
MGKARAADVPRSRLESLAIAALLCVLVLLALKCAWVCDDAYITFRVVDNFVEGHGLRWNVAERVQAYTNPLWLAAMTPFYAVTREPYYTSLALGLATTFAAAALLAYRGARDLIGALLALLVLAGSKAFVDYSTSGLENPLLHLALAAAFVAQSAALPSGRKSLALGLCASAVALTRLDGLLLVAPLLALHAWNHRAPRDLAQLALGCAPLLAWEAFSLVYYGSLVPNTAVAKLATGLPQSELSRQGLAYLADSLRADPVTLAAIFVAFAVAAWRRERALLAAAAGGLLQLAYITHVGGDFMSGRFLTGALFTASFVLGAARLDARVAFALAAAVLAASGLSPRSPLRAPIDYAQGRASREFIEPTGIADERGYWFTVAGLFSDNRTTEGKLHVSKGHPYAQQLREKGPKVLRAEGIGYLGYWAGPDVHLVDPMGLSDAFLARLPIYVNGEFVEKEKNAANGSRGWRIGHFYRRVPEGYLESLADPSQEIGDPKLAELRREIDLLTRAPLFDGERWRAIARHAL